jgi:hypothetical protein
MTTWIPEKPMVNTATNAAKLAAIAQGSPWCQNRVTLRPGCPGRRVRPPFSPPIRVRRASESGDLIHAGDQGTQGGDRDQDLVVYLGIESGGVRAARSGPDHRLEAAQPQGTTSRVREEDEIRILFNLDPQRSAGPSC